jgi:hypothetical protein
MITLKLSFSNQLKSFLDSSSYNYELTEIGWHVILKFIHTADVFYFGKQYGEYCAVNPRLSTIEKLEESGDI